MSRRQVPQGVLEDPFSIGAQIRHAQQMRDFPRRNRLMAYANARGATIRQLGDLTGLTSTSTIAAGIHRARSNDKGVLADACPMDL